MAIDDWYLEFFPGDVGKVPLKFLHGHDELIAAQIVFIFADVPDTNLAVAQALNGTSNSEPRSRKYSAHAYLQKPNACHTEREL